jgi:hypothetical protein
VPVKLLWQALGLHQQQQAASNILLMPGEACKKLVACGAANT